MTRIVRSNVVTALVFLIALVCSWLVLARLAGADVDAGQMVPDAGLVDTRVAADNPDPGAAAPTPATTKVDLSKLQTTPPSAAQAPGDAGAGFLAWLKLSWIYAALFAGGSLALAAGAVWPSLRRGKKAIAIGTFVAAVSSALAAKAAGLPDAKIVYAAMSIVMTGLAWGLAPNRTTIDLSTATPEQIADALKRADGAKAAGA